MLNYRYCETLSIIEKSVLHRPTWSQSRKQHRQNHLSFPTNADLPDNLPTRWHPTTTPISENSSANGCSRNFELFSFFRVFTKKHFWWARAPRLVRLCSSCHITDWHWTAGCIALYTLAVNTDGEVCLPGCPYLDKWSTSDAMWSRKDA